MAKAYDLNNLPYGSLATLSVPDKIARAAIAWGATLAPGSDVYNIIYTEEVDLTQGDNGEWEATPNHTDSNQFNDTRLLLQVIADKPVIVGAWDATTEPGKFWTEHRMDERGAFHIAAGYQKCWVMGEYHDAPALLQFGKIAGYRDGKNSRRREGRLYIEDNLGVHHHGGYDLPRVDIGRSSAGCQVGRTTKGHARFMSLLKTDRRYTTNRNYVFASTVIPPGSIV